MLTLIRFFCIIFIVRSQEAAKNSIRPLGQAVKTPPFHGGNMGSSPVGVTILWAFSSAGRASALQAEGHRFEPCNAHHKIWPGSSAG